MAKGYIIADLAMTGMDGMDHYGRVARERLTAHNGRLLVAGGPAKVLEGPGGPNTWIVLEFDSPEDAAAWYDDPAYQAVVPIRQRNGSGRLVCVEGWTPPSN